MAGSLVLIPTARRAWCLAGRSQEPDARMTRQLEAARVEGAIVCTTPDVVKSLFLKFVELLHLPPKPKPTTRGRARRVL